MRTIQDMVQQEVMCCMSSVVSALAQAEDGTARHTALGALIDQAFELASHIDDYEEAAIQAGWQAGSDRFPFARTKTAEERARNDDDDNGPCVYAESWEKACEHDGLEPYAREVYEHWAVTGWLAKQLIAHGEKVDEDFAGLCMWARTTTGQAIHADGVIERIYAEMMQS